MNKPSLEIMPSWVATLPSPVALAVQGCYSAVESGERERAGRSLSETVLAFLRVAGLSWLRHRCQQPGDSLSARAMFGVARAFRWDDPADVARLFSIIAELVRADGGGNESSIWLPALTTSRVAALVEADGDAVLDELEHGELSGMCRWTLLEKPASAAQDEFWVHCGLVPQRQFSREPGAKLLQSGFWLATGTDIVRLSPCLWREALPWISSDDKSHARCVTRPVFHLVQSLAPEQGTEVMLPELGFMVRRDDSRERIASALTHPLPVARDQSSAWGVALVRVAAMREFNQRHGHKAGDRVLAAVSLAASRLRSDVDLRLPGEIAFFPFWRRGGEMMIAFRHAVGLDPARSLSLVMEALTEVVTAAHRASPVGGPRMEAAIHLQGTTVLAEDADVERLPGSLLSALEALREALPCICPGQTSGTAWLLELGDGSPRLQRWDEPAFRISRGAFGIITRGSGDGLEMLVRFNHNHQRLNLIGGHVEAEDAGKAERTVERELAEELGCRRSHYDSLMRLLPHPLHHHASSAPNGARMTCYLHDFFLVNGTTPDLEMAAFSHECQWIPVTSAPSSEVGTLSPVPMQALRATGVFPALQPLRLNTSREVSRRLFGFADCETAVVSGG